MFLIEPPGKLEPPLVILLYFFEWWVFFSPVLLIIFFWVWIFYIPWVFPWGFACYFSVGVIFLFFSSTSHFLLLVSIRDDNSCSRVVFVLCQPISIQLYGSTYTNPICLLNGSRFLNPNTIHLLNGLIMLTYLLDFIKMKKKLWKNKKKKI